jgi:hypothetical protein
MRHKCERVLAERAKGVAAGYSVTREVGGDYSAADHERRLQAYERMP